MKIILPGDAMEVCPTLLKMRGHIPEPARTTSQYFSTIEPQKDWWPQLTEEVTTIKQHTWKRIIIHTGNGSSFYAWMHEETQLVVL